jgi:hypothetical protein
MIQKKGVGFRLFLILIKCVLKVADKLTVRLSKTITTITTKHFTIINSSVTT